MTTTPTKAENPSAFPLSKAEDQHGNVIYEGEPGMTLRDWFAGQALSAIITATSAGQHMPGGGYQPDDNRSMAEKFAIDAFEIADALLAQRSKQP